MLMPSWQTSMLHSELYFVYIQLFDVTSILLFFKHLLPIMLHLITLELVFHPSVLHCVIRLLLHPLPDTRHRAGWPDITRHGILKKFQLHHLFHAFLLNWMWVCDCCSVKMREIFHIPFVLPEPTMRLHPTWLVTVFSKFFAAFSHFFHAFLLNWVECECVIVAL